MIPVGEISHQGVFIDVSLNRVGSSFAGIQVRGLIDTGATNIVISTSMADKIGLRHVYNVDLDVVGGGSVPARVHSALIKIPELYFEQILPIHAVKWPQNTDTVLLGREFLRHFIFYYDGPKNMFYFSKLMDGMHEFPENLDG